MNQNGMSLDKRTCLLLACIFCPLLFWAQTIYQKKYLSTVATEHIDFGASSLLEGKIVTREVSNGDRITVGAISDPGGIKDILLFRTANNGSILWEQRFHGPKSSFPTDVWPTSDGGFVVCGSHDKGVEETQGFLLKTDADGTLAWVKSYGGPFDDQINSMLKLGDGYMLVGATKNRAEAPCPNNQYCSYSILVIRTDLSGNVVDHNIVSLGEQNNNEYGYGIVRQKTGGFVVLGDQDADNIVAFGTDADLNVLWLKKYSRIQGFIQGHSIEPVSGGGYAIAGSHSIGGTFSNMFLLKISNTGTSVWAKSYDINPNSDNNFAIDLAISSGGFVLAGTRKLTGSTIENGFAIKTDQNGNVVWEKSYGTSSSKIALSSVVKTSDGGLLFGGVSTPEGQFQQSAAYCVKTNAIGGSGCDESVVSTTATNRSIIDNDPAYIEYTGISDEPYALSTPVASLSVLTPCIKTCPGSNIVVTISGTSQVCGVNGTTTLTANATGGDGNNQYIWGGGSTTQSVNNAGAGVWSVTVQDGNGCLGSATFTVTQVNPPTVTISSNSGTDVCKGELFTLAANINYGGPYSIKWYLSTAPGTILGVGNSFNPSTSTVGNYTYCAEVTIFQGCSTIECFAFSVLPNPVISSLNPVYCAGGPVDQFQGTNSWINQGTFTCSPAGAIYSQQFGQNTYWFFNPSATPGTYVITYCLNATGCCTSQTVTLVGKPAEINIGELCVLDPCIDLTLWVGQPGATFSGPGVTGNMFCPSEVGAGTYLIHYTYPVPPPCNIAALIQITVTNGGDDWPKLAAEPGINVGNERGKAIFKGADGAFYVCGYYDNTIELDANNHFIALNNGGSGGDMFVAKYNDCGVEWAMTASNQLGWLSWQTIMPTDIVHADGKVYVTGHAKDNSGLSNAFILCLKDTDGNINGNFGTNGEQWLTQGPQNQSWSNRISVSLPNDRLYITGGLRGTFTFAMLNQAVNGTYTNGGIIDTDLYLAAYDLNGAEVWMTALGGKEDDMGNGVVAYSNGDVAVTGTVSEELSGNNCGSISLSNAGGSLDEIFVGRFFYNGCEDWAVINGGIYDDKGVDIKLDGNGDLLVMGTFRTDQNGMNIGLNNQVSLSSYNTNRSDIFLARYASSNGDGLGAVRSGKLNGSYVLTPRSLWYAPSSDAIYIGGSFMGGIVFAQSQFATNSTIDVDPFVMRFDASNLGETWASQGETPPFPNPDDRDEGWDVIADDAGNAYLVGGFSREIQFAPQPVLTSVAGFDYYAVRLNATGQFYKMAAEETEGEATLAPLNFKAFPNPSNGKFEIVLEGAAAADCALRMMDLEGRVVLEKQMQAGQNRCFIDATPLSKGMYMLQLSAGNQRLTQKVVVQ